MGYGLERGVNSPGMLKVRYGLLQLGSQWNGRIRSGPVCKGVESQDLVGSGRVRNGPKGRSGEDKLWSDWVWHAENGLVQESKGLLWLVKSAISKMVALF